MNSLLVIVLCCLIAPVLCDMRISITADPGVLIEVSPYPFEAVEINSPSSVPVEFEDISYLMTYGTDVEFMNFSLNASDNGSFFSSVHGGVLHNDFS